MILIIILLSAIVYYLGATYVIQTRFKNSPKSLNYWQSLTIFGFFIKMAAKHPFKGRRLSGVIAVILMYQIFAQILKAYYFAVYEKHPELDQKALLAVAKRKFEEGIANVYETIDSTDTR
ncbi:hypothetical protein D1157_19920 [Anaerotruncus sp. X29]|nr:hypothetical protein [Anaerotruncus sp. X29]